MILRALAILLLAAGPAFAGSLSVQVVATDGAGAEMPAPGARVLVRPATEVLWPERDLLASPLVADREGKLTVERPDGPAVVVAGMALRGTAVERVPAGVDRVRLVLPPEAILEGVVVGPDGRPVPAAEILVAPERPEDTGEFLAPGSAVVSERTDGAGRFVVYRLRPGRRYRVRARAPHLAPAVRRDLLAGRDQVRLRLPQGATIRGLVVSVPGGEPVAGATVSAGGVSARSDDDGRFELRGVPPGAFRLSARAAGHLNTRDEDLVLLEGEVRVGVLVRVIGMGRMTGKVLDPATRPAAGAEILLRYPPDPDLESRLPEDRIVRGGRTGDDGSFDLRDLYPAQGVDLIVRHAGHAPTVYYGFSILAAETVDVVVLLRNGGRLAGEVLDEARVPLAGARVLALDDRLDLGALSRGEVPWSPTACETESGEDGTFELDHVPGGRRALVAIAPDRLPVVLRGVDIAEGAERTGLVLTPAPAADISGFVRDPEGRPLAGARIVATPEIGPAHEGRSDETGGFRISSLAPGPYGLAVEAEGFAPFTARDVAAPSEDVEVELSPAAGLTGRVLRETGSGPAAPAVVRAFVRLPPDELDPDRPRYRLAGETRAEPPDATFRLSDLPPGRYRIEAVSEDGSYGFLDGLALGAEASAAPITIRVLTGQTLCGRVLSGRTGLPLEGATVAIRGPTDEPGPFVATTDRTGSWTIRGVPAGFHTLVAAAEDHAPVRRESVEVRLAVDTRVDDLVLPVGGTISGVVTGPEGELRKGAEIRLRSADLGGTRSVRTDESGRFRFEHVAAGTYLLTSDESLSSPGGRRRERLVSVGDDEELVLDIGTGAGSTLTGRVTAGGEPVAHARVDLLRADGSPATDRQIVSTTTDADGNYVFPDVTPGDLLLLVAPSGRSSAEARFPVRLRPGPVTIEDLVLPDSGLEGAVENLDTGERLPGVTLELERVAPGSEGTFLARLTRQLGETVSGEEGEFRFVGVPEGTYRLRAWREGFGQTLVENVHVLRGGLTPVRVAMPPAGSLAGRVVDRDGAPVTSARVSFRDARGRLATRDPWIPVDSSGRFRVDSLRTGTYTVEAVGPGLARARRPDVEVFPGSVPEVELRLAAEGRLWVTVYGPGGTRIEGARVTVRDFWGARVRTEERRTGLLTPLRDPALTDADGTVILSHLAPGLYEVRAEVRGYSGEPARVRVLDGELSRGAVVLLPARREIK